MPRRSTKAAKKRTRRVPPAAAAAAAQQPDLMQMPHELLLMIQSYLAVTDARSFRNVSRTGRHVLKEPLAIDILVENLTKCKANTLPDLQPEQKLVIVNLVNTWAHRATDAALEKALLPLVQSYPTYEKDCVNIFFNTTEPRVALHHGHLMRRLKEHNRLKLNRHKLYTDKVAELKLCETDAEIKRSLIFNTAHERLLGGGDRKINLFMQIIFEGETRLMKVMWDLFSHALIAKDILHNELPCRIWRDALDFDEGVDGAQTIETLDALDALYPYNRNVYLCTRPYPYYSRVWEPWIREHRKNTNPCVSRSTAKTITEALSYVYDEIGDERESVLFNNYHFKCFDDKRMFYDDGIPNEGDRDEADEEDNDNDNIEEEYNEVEALEEGVE
jgi:hypothetical protein